MSAASASTSRSSPPNTALYLKNISSKVKKAEVRRQLYGLCLSYGRVLDVVATRAKGMRGQAFVVFEDLAGSTSALRALDGFQFYGQPLMIEYARQKSKATIVQEHGAEALFDPTLMPKLREERLAAAATVGQANGVPPLTKVTFSSAGAELQGRERKRAREEAGQRGEGPIVKGDRSDDSAVEEQEEDDDDEEEDGGSNDPDGPPSVKRRKSEVTSDIQSVAGSTAAEKGAQVD